tara:strand:- start:8 stop:178 length:171 start_codon:yes stop_codon:yes gene_type:complete
MLRNFFIIKEYLKKLNCLLKEFAVLVFDYFLDNKTSKESFVKSIQKNFFQCINQAN